MEDEERMRGKRVRRCRWAGTISSLIGAVLLLGALSLSLYHACENERAGRESARLLLGLKDRIKGIGQAGEMDTHEAGILTIPALDLELPVFEQWNYDRLKQAPCIQYGSIQEGNLVIAGHNYSHHFGKLSRLKKSDQVWFTGLDGKTKKYSVEMAETIGKDEAHRIRECGYELVMYTCTYSGRERTAVFCRAQP